MSQALSGSSPALACGGKRCVVGHFLPFFEKNRRFRLPKRFKFKILSYWILTTLTVGLCIVRIVQQKAFFMCGNIYQYQETLKQEGISLSFMGPLSQRLMEEFVGNLRERMAQEGIGLSTCMRVFAVAVEQVQNILRFSAETVPPEGDYVKFHIGSIHIGYKDGQYFVASGNQIASENVKFLQEHLTRLSRMTPEELKVLHKELRRQPLNSENLTGLGLVEIARKASRPLEFDFRDIDERRAYFSMKTVI